MEFRKAAETEVNNIINIIKQAQAYFKEQGINQWQDNYPNIETISNDIANKNSYVLLNMQKLLKKNKFQFCRIIYLEDKSKRIAFKKIL